MSGNWWDEAPLATAAPAPAPAQTQTGEDKWWEAAPVAGAASLATPDAPERPDGRQHGMMNAAARGFVDGIPIAGPALLGAIDKGDAAVRALVNDTKYSDETARAADYDKQVQAEHPYAHFAGEIGGGIVGTAPLVMAAPAAFGASAAALPVRMLAAGGSGLLLGGADAAVRSDGDPRATAFGAGLGAGLGAAGPAVGRGIGKVAQIVTGGEPGMHMLQQAARGFSESELAAAQSLRDQAASLPGTGVGLSAGEALNAATGGRATRMSQLERVAANSGGEGGQIAGEFYAARPAQIDGAARAAFDAIGEQPTAPSALGLDVQAAARAGVAQTPEGMALTAARDAAGPRISPYQAGQTIQSDLRTRADALDAARSTQAAQDYGAARAAPENVGIERQITVERPGEPIVTPQAYSRPQFEGGAPRPLDTMNAADQAAGAGPESLARFVARNGGIRLDGEAAATDLHRFNIPGAGNVARPTGKGIDDFWREHLIEHGYLRPDADGGAARDISSELLRKLQNEQRGVPSYPIGTQPQQAGRAAGGRQADEYANAMSLADSRLQEDLAKAGIDPARVHPEIRSRVVGSLIRGQHTDPLDAYEAVVGAMRENPPPLVKTPTVTEQIPDVRFGQVDPRPAMAAVAEQARTAKGDVRGALASAGSDLRGPDGHPDMSVAGLLHARERLDVGIQTAQEMGDRTKVRDLQVTRSALDGQLKQVPEVATADQNFAANSRPLEPFQGNAPLAQATRREGNAPDGRFMMPAEQVPGLLSGPTAANDALANGTPAVRDALGRRLQTQIIDGATSPDGTVSAHAMRAGMLQHEDVLAQLPEVRDRLSGIARARDGMARVEASPLGRIAQRPDIEAATDAIFASNPGAGSHNEVAAAMGALTRNDPHAAEQLARYHLETVFNDATQVSRGLPAQYGGAGWASILRGDSQQARNLEATFRALPNGEVRWRALDRLMTTLEATGYRPQKGSDTAFNQAIQKELASGKTHVGQAISDALTGGAAGMIAGGPKASVAGLVVGAKHGIGDALTRARMLNNGEAIARLMFDPKALPDLRALSHSPPGSKNAEMFSARLLSLANGGAGEQRRSEATR